MDKKEIRKRILEIEIDYYKFLFKKKDKCMYCNDELNYDGYPVCGDCFLERLSPEDMRRLLPISAFQKEIDKILNKEGSVNED